MCEMVQGGRTWFGTLTVEPTRRYLIVCEAEKLAGKPLSELSEAQRYAEQWRVLGAEITRAMKRLRKSLEKKKAAFRFCLVSEPHQDGFPHAHFLLTETEG